MIGALRPVLVIAIGNPSRGDDALGPRLAEALRDEGWFDGTEAELLEAFQLQPEDALDLEGRRAVLFVDAARGRAAADAARAPEVTLAPLTAAGSTALPFTHALAPAALLAVAQRIGVPLPARASLLAIPGDAFELGAPLSAPARARARLALALARGWLAAAGVLLPRASGRPADAAADAAVGAAAGAVLGAAMAAAAAAPGRGSTPGAGTHAPVL